MDLVEQYRIKYCLSNTVYNTITTRQLISIPSNAPVQQYEIASFPAIDDIHGEGIICAPRRSGKTAQLVARGIYTIATKRDHHVLFVIPQWSGYRRVVMEMFDQVMFNSGIPMEQFSRSEYMICNRETGSEIILSNVNTTPPVSRRLSSDVASNQQLLVLIDEPHYTIRDRFVEYMEHIVLPEQPFRIAAYGSPSNTTVSLGYYLERCSTIPNLVFRHSELV